MRRLICTLGLAALLAACGSSGSSAPKTGGPPRDFASFEQAAYHHAVCMRQHGVPSYPDPVPTTHDGEQGIRQDLPPGMVKSPAFHAADKDCLGLLPYVKSADTSGNAQAGEQRELGLLSFADCMRAHGVSNFPDPNAQGQLSVQTLAADGVNVHLPYVFDAAVKCIPASHGVLSRTDIANAESQAG